MSRTHNGCFIAIEGIDGAGTTTQAGMLAAHLREQRRVAHLTREPSDGPIGSLIRLALRGRVDLGGSCQAQTMALLFAADRLDHIGAEVAQHLNEGAIVVSDRYDLSSIAYQSVTARPADAPDSRDAAVEAWVRDLNRFALRPDVTLVIEVDPKEAERRRRSRRGLVELYETSDLQRRLCEMYAAAEELLPNDRIVRIDGNRGVDAVFEDVCAATEAHL